MSGTIFAKAATRAICASLALTAAAALAACASPSSYAGISLKPGAADLELQELARRAKAGDKHAQLDLGIRFEEGVGLPVDRIRAARLYTSAATASGGVRWIYVPPVGSRKQGQTMAVSGGPAVPGLPAAKQRLRDLQKRLGR